MAKPRVFVSSTYYDLKSVRSSLERFIRDRGYDPILNERGNITYSKEISPEQSCYIEVETCDILISIVGGRPGNSSIDESYSISQMELKTALDQYKQVYVFVERDVLSEYRTYLKNKGSDINWSAVDDVKIYNFLEEIYSLPNNNAIMGFETGNDIVDLLREQWAGLFQRLLQSSSAAGTYEVAQELRQSVDTARQLVELLSFSGQVTGGEDAAKSAILEPNHPSFSRIKRILKVPYRVYFSTEDELNSWLKVRNFRSVNKNAWDSPDTMEWYSTKDIVNWDLLKISTSLFDVDGRFHPDKEPWDPLLIRREVRPRDDDPVAPDDPD